MASTHNRRHAPTTDREVEMLDDLAARLVALGLTAAVHHGRREILARQPGITSGIVVLPTGLSQVVTLARSRTTPDTLAWVITLDEGFRGESGTQFQSIAAGEDLDTAARKLANILALVDDAPVRESVL